MRKTVLSILFVVVGLAVAVIAEAQQPKKVPRIGFLASASPSIVSDRIDAFRQGLRELGYVEEKNIVIESRYAEGKLDRVPALVAELVSLKVEILVSTRIPGRQEFRGHNTNFFLTEYIGFD